MNTTTMTMGGPVALASEAHKPRYGLIAARIGRDIMVRLTIPMTVEPPKWNNVTQAELGTRTRIAPKNVHFEHRVDPGTGTKTPVRVLPGAPVYLQVQDVTRVEPELAIHAKWRCSHPECSGRTWDSKEDLVRGHADNRDLIAMAEQAPEPWNRKPHVYYGMIEIPAVEAKPEAKDEKTGKVTPARTAQQSVVMAVSDEE